MYNTPGIYAVTLRVQNSSGADSITKTDFITVRSTPGTAMLPFAEGFESVSFPSNTWLINKGLDSPTWEIAGVGATGSKSVRIQNINATKNDEDGLVSPVYHKTGTGSMTLNFKTAYAMQHASDNDLLRVMFSGDCGGTMYTVQTYSVASLGNNTNPVAAPYVPAAGDWVQHTLPFSIAPNITDFVLVFSFTNGGGNNIYLDDINISQAVSVEELSVGDLKLQVMPNPFGEATSLQLDALSSRPVQIELNDVTGKTVYREETLLHAGSNTLTLQRNGLAPGLYFLNLYSKSGKVSHKLIIQ